MIFSDSFGKDSTFPPKTKVAAGVRIRYPTRWSSFTPPFGALDQTHWADPTPSPRGICAWGSLELYTYIYYLYIHISYVLYKYCVWSISTSIIWIYDLVHRCIYIIHMYNICVYRYLYKANTCTYGSLITLTTNVTYARTACLFPFHFRHGPQIATLAPLSDDFHPDFWPRNLCAKNVKQMSVQTWEPFQTMWKK